MKTVRVKIAVAVNTNGNWAANGFGGDNSKSKSSLDIMKSIARESLDYDSTPEMVVHWIEADVPIPESQTIQGDLSNGSS